jgi:hypothetical protein
MFDRLAWFRVVVAAYAYPPRARAELADYLQSLGDDYATGLADALRDRTHRRLPVSMKAVN